MDASSKDKPRGYYGLRLGYGHRLRGFHGFPRYPIRKWFALRSVRSAGGVLVADSGQLLLPEAAGELDERGPQAAVNERDLPFDELADQDVGAVGNRRRRPEDLLPLG
jgi:hypothetical protein